MDGDDSNIIGMPPGKYDPAIMRPPHRPGQRPPFVAVDPDAPVGMTPLNVKYSHHEAARLVALGKKPSEVALATGFSPGTISGLMKRAEFNDLVGYYADLKEMIFADVLARMRQLGLDTLDELQTRLHDNPASFDNRTLIELGEMLLVKSGGRAGAGNGAASAGTPGGSTINVTFVGSAGGSQMLDVTPMVSVTQATASELVPA